MKLAIKMGRRKSNEIGDDLFTGGVFQNKKKVSCPDMFMIGYSVSVAKVCARVCQWRRRRRLSSSPKSIDRPGEEESVDKRTSPQELTGLLFPHLTRGSYPIAESAIFFFLLKKKKKKRSFLLLRDYSGNCRWAFDCIRFTFAQISFISFSFFFLGQPVKMNQKDNCITSRVHTGKIRGGGATQLET